MTKKRPPQVIQNTKAVVVTDEQCPDCESKTVEKAEGIKLTCTTCGFWWNDYGQENEDGQSPSS